MVFTETTWPIHIVDLNCSGHEDSIWDCSYNELLNDMCNEDDDAAVICQCNKIIIAIFIILLQFCTLLYIIVHFPLFADWHIDENVANYNNCSTGDIRLQDGSNEYEGRAEVCVNGVWGSICHNGWDKSDANAFCGQLGYSSYGIH